MVALALCLAGCTGATHTEPGETYTMATIAGLGRKQGFVLDRREVIEFPDGIDEDCSECDDARVDFTIWNHGPVYLGLARSNSFCLKGEDFDSVEDIPSDISDCDWGSAFVASSSHDDNEKLQLGYIVRDRSQSRYWRLRVVKVNIYDDSPFYEAVFEVAEFEE